MKISVGERIQDQNITAANSKLAKPLKLSELADGKPVILVFHRFYGCLLSQYDLHEMVREYQSIVNPEFCLAFVMQTPVEELEKDAFASAVPFELISDPEEKLYRLFGVSKAESKEELVEGIQSKLDAARAMGLVHGNDTGDPLQLPAVFILNPDLTVAYAYYCRSGADLPKLSDLSKHLKSIC